MAPQIISLFSPPINGALVSPACEDYLLLLGVSHHHPERVKGHLDWRVKSLSPVFALMWSGCQETPDLQRLAASPCCLAAFTSEASAPLSAARR